MMVFTTQDICAIAKVNNLLLAIDGHEAVLYSIDPYTHAKRPKKRFASQVTEEGWTWRSVPLNS